MISLIKFVLFQTAWFSCVYLAGKAATFAFIPMVIWTLIALYLSNHRTIDIKLMVLITIIGFIVDTILIHIGVLDLPSLVSPLWLVSMWTGFSLTVSWAYQKMERNILLMTVLGFLAGALSYRGGAIIGGIVIAEPEIVSLAVIGLFWGIFFPIFVRLAMYFRNTGP